MTTKIRGQLGRFAALTGAAAALLALAACEPDEEILAGDRFDLRDLESGAEQFAAERDAVQDTLDVRPPTKLPQRPYLISGEAAKISLPGARALNSWPQFAQNAENLTPHAQLRSGALTRVWATDFGAGNGKRLRLFSPPVGAGGRLFVIDSEMTVSALSSSGAVIWQRSLVPPTDKVGEATGGGLALSGQTLFVTTGYGALHALDTASGVEKWRQFLDAAATSAPTVADGIVYVATRNGFGSAIDVKNGRILWQLEGSADQATVIGSGVPAIAGNAVVFPFNTGELVTVLRKGGVNLWTGSVTGRRLGAAYSGINGIAGGPIVAGRTLYTATSAGRLVALDASSGDPLWTALEGATGNPILAGGSLFAVADDARLLRIKASDGALVWSATLPQFQTERVRRRKDVYVHHGPILAGGRLIVASSDGYLREISPSSGELIRVTELGDAAAAPPIVIGNTLYVITGEGTLHAFR